MNRRFARRIFISVLFLLLCLFLPLTVPAEESAAENGSREEAQYYGFIGKKMNVYAKGSESSGILGTIEADTKVDVYKKMRTWTIIDYNGKNGYVLTKYIERVQRKNPFDGPMPGVSTHVAVGYVLTNTSFRPEGYKYPIEVSAGSWLSIEEIKDGKAYFPYRREKDNVCVSTDNLKVYDFVSWDKAQPGDLLYAFTTFYPTSPKRTGNVGRMYNIQIASDRLTGIRIPAGETFSFNAVCGPYTQENGYREAPILSGESSTGYGGGVCQVCSTIYNIVLRMPLVIEDMNWHSQGGTSYLPSGFDATVGSKSDMVFRNILPYDLRLEFENLNGIMTAFLFRAYDE